jgi:hypothetical protein
MSKKEDLLHKLQPILNNQKELEKFLVQNSNLPGPRANLELAFAFSEVFTDLDVLLEWLKITPDQADVNNPKSFLAFCSAVCLGKIYIKTKNQNLIEILKKLASDERWRMREAVVFAFQYIGEDNFEDLTVIFSKWIKVSDNFEKRAVLASLAHPKFLNKKNAQFCFEISEIILTEMDLENNFDVLKKGLSYSLSVYVAANPDFGFPFLKRWIGKNKLIDKIIKENLKKNRLVKKYAEEVKNTLNYIESN